MRGRHAAGGWSPFWRDIILRTVLALLLVAMIIFIWWLFSEDDLFTEAVATTSVPETTATSDVMTTGTEPEEVTTTTTRPATTAATEADTTTSTTAAVTTTSSTTTTVPPPLDPAQLVVRVLNANGVQGVAGRMSGLLEEAGYGVTAPDNHAQRLDVSRVWYRDGLSREAALLRQELVPDALIEAIPLEQEGIDIVVVLGRSFEE